MSKLEREGLVKEYAEVEDQLDLIRKEISKIYYPLLTELLSAHDLQGAKELMDELPHCVTKCFMADQIRQYQGAYDEEPERIG